jgi:hypothetical protein
MTVNERIQELYNQSLEEKYQYGGSDAKPGEMYSNYITVLNPEKFAQLIVRECANIAADMSALDIYEEIREHFGVEE